MRNAYLALVAVGLFFMPLTASTGNADTQQQEIVIAFFPCTDAVSGFKKFNPLLTYLNKRTQLNIRHKFYQDFDSYERGLQNDSLYFVLQEPHIYRRYIEYYNPASRLHTLTWEGKPTQSGVVIARIDSGIKTLTDLKQRSVMFGPKVSAARWLAAKRLFTENGIDIDVDLKEFANGGCCEDIAFNVYLKAVDAGVVCDHFLDEHRKKQRNLGFDAGQLVVIGVTRPVPTKIFTATRRVAPDIVAKVNQALLSLDINVQPSRRILHAAEIGAFFEPAGQNGQ